jgi:RHS repeat-associated protein
VDVEEVGLDGGEAVGDRDGRSTSPMRSRDARQFAAKERDGTGLDYFGARYCASQTGRFSTVDPVVPIEDALLDPQRWNRYTYVMKRLGNIYGAPASTSTRTATARRLTIGTGRN